jgi:hypothetical protein
LFSRLKRFLLFEGPVSFKKIKQFGGNVEFLKAYRLIPLTAPLPGQFTVPLESIISPLDKLLTSLVFFC